jgi:hypothetical protein
VDLCTTPAVYQSQTSQGQECSVRTQSANTRGWEQLAAFLFGPNWLAIPLSSEDSYPQRSSSQGTAYETKNGKQGPNTNHTITSNTGWNAPYLDLIPHFPINLRKKANPNSYIQSVGESFHDVYAPEEEACNGDSVIIGRNHVHKTLKKVSVESSMQAENLEKPLDNNLHHSIAQSIEEDLENKYGRIPDELFYESSATSFWGCVEQTRGAGELNKAGTVLPPRPESMINSTDPEKCGMTIPSTPITGKRVRFDERYEETSIGKKLRSDRRRPAYIPKFLPMLPPVRTYGNTTDDNSWSSGQSNDRHILSVVNNQVGSIEDLSNLAQPVSHLPTQTGYKYSEESVAAVRQSLVNMEQSIGSSFWGSIQSQNGEDAKGSPSTLSKAMVSEVHVTKGLPKGDPGIAPKQALIVPMGRASGSRVSRIIEGSLDAAIQ